jgi:histidinol-phosphate/aromatic aminotransferase/cobyric acid decarboxylase-like protein
LGYALTHPERLQRWAGWRDPWPVNGLAAALAEQLLGDPRGYRRWCARVQDWVGQEGRWWQAELASIPGLRPLPSAANYLLVEGDQSLVPLLQRLEQRHRILLRDCRSFAGLGERWLRIGYQDRRGNRAILAALRSAFTALDQGQAV